MFKLETGDVGWWYWLAIAVCISLGVGGYEAGYNLCVLLSILCLTHFVIRDRSLSSFPVQTRIAFCALVAIAYLEHMRWLYFLPMLGLWAQVFFGYCPMARTMSLAPWNRETKFSFALLKQAYISRPVRGTVMQGFAALNS